MCIRDSPCADKQINEMSSVEDRILIKVLITEKGHGAKKIIIEFPRKNRSLTSVNRLLRQIDSIGSADRCCRIRDVNHLKERLIEEWHHFDHRIIDRAVSQWRQRLHSCIHENGGYFDHQI